MDISVSVHKDGKVFLMPHVMPPEPDAKYKPMHPTTIIKQGESAFGYSYEELVKKHKTVITARA